MNPDLVLNPLSVFATIVFLLVNVIVLWLYSDHMHKRLKKLERKVGFDITLPDGTTFAHTIRVVAGTDLKAGEPVFIAEDGKAYPVGLKREVPEKDWGPGPHPEGGYRPRPNPNGPTQPPTGGSSVKPPREVL